MVNILTLTPLSQINPYYNAGSNTQLWRVCFKTNNISNVSAEMLFTYKNDNTQFNLTSTTPYKYMTLLHLGTDTSRTGLQVCLVRRNSDSNNIEIGVRYSNGTAWTELSGYFYSIPTADLAGLHFMLVYNGGTSPVTVNFYVTAINMTVKTAPDFTATGQSSLTSSMLGGQFAYGSAQETTVSTGVKPSSSDWWSDGYIATEGYNSTISQNVSYTYCRYWSTTIPVSSNNASTYAIFNTAASSHSLYYLVSNNIYVPAGTTNLEWQLFIPADNQTLSNLANNAVSPSVAVTLTNSVTGFAPLTSFGVNNASSFNTVTTSTIVCILKGTKILTPSGYRLIEDLKINDYVYTHDLKKSKIVKIEVMNALPIDSNKPKIIRKGKLGAFEDLYISPNHSVLYKKKLFPAKLLNLETLDIYHIQYYSIMLENLKDTLVANGVIVESWGGFDPKSRKFVCHSCNKDFPNNKNLRIHNFRHAIAKYNSKINTLENIPKITVLFEISNSENLAKSIESLLSQTYYNLNIIINNPNNLQLPIINDTRIIDMSDKIESEYVLLFNDKNIIHPIAIEYLFDNIKDNDVCYCNSMLINFNDYNNSDDLIKISTQDNKVKVNRKICLIKTDKIKSDILKETKIDDILIFTEKFENLVI